VAADRQTAGRGRMQNTWHSPAGLNLYFSVLLRPEIVPAKIPQLALVTAVGLITALKNNFPDLNPRIKWPNDILVQDRKLAGILCEMQMEADKIHHVIIGAGINVNSRSGTYPPDLRGQAISLLDATGLTSSREKLIADILTELERCYELWLEQGLTPFLAMIDENSAIRDREITVVMQNKEISGIARGLSDDGYLKLETPEGILKFPAGEVHLRKI
jgi:BirA family biotin operon repressor/biotin-[acetyl-CoA-carboxylase] ligase